MSSVLFNEGVRIRYRQASIWSEGWRVERATMACTCSMNRHSTLLHPVECGFIQHVPPSARPRRGRAEAGPYARSPLSCQQLFHTPEDLSSYAKTSISIDVLLCCCYNTRIIYAMR